jgi:hypothetical protein
MILEGIKVRVGGVSRAFPIDKVFIRWEPEEDDGSPIRVRVVYPSYILDGEITFQVMKHLLDYGCRARVDVHTGEDYHPRLIRSIEQAKRELAERKKSQSTD